jgi:hypothetical protein
MMIPLEGQDSCQLIAGRLHNIRLRGPPFSFPLPSLRNIGGKCAFYRGENSNVGGVHHTQSAPLWAAAPLIISLPPQFCSTVVAFHRCERLPTTSSLPSLFARLTSDPTAIHHRHLYPPRFPPSQPTPIRSLPAFAARRVIQARPAATPGHGTIHFTRDDQSIRSFSLPSSLVHRRCHRPIESLSHVVRKPAAYTRASPSRTPWRCRLASIPTHSPSDFKAKLQC